MRYSTTATKLLKIKVFFFTDAHLNVYVIGLNLKTANDVYPSCLPCIYMEGESNRAVPEAPEGMRYRAGFDRCLFCLVFFFFWL